MKILKILVVTAIVAVACQPADSGPDPAEEAFKRNSEVVKADLDNWIAETVDYSNYAEDYWSVGTAFGDTDTTNLEDMKEFDAYFLNAYDFEFLTDLQLLPGVNAETKKMDGSVRYYGDWKVTKTATDSTAEKSGVIAMYSTFEFNEEGKITSSTAYGDFTGLMNYLNSSDDME